MKSRRNKAVSNLLGYVAFFLTIATCVTVCFSFFTYVDKKTGGNDKVTSIVVFLLIAFLSLICTLIDVVRRRVTVDRPLEKILSATERMTKGDFSVRLETSHPYGKYDEYDVIMENLNVLAAELEKTEILKTDFVANVSHELKTPLAVVANYASALANGEADEEERKRYLQTIVKATGRLNALIGNVLKLNKLEHRQIQPEYKKTDLAEELAQAVLRFEDAIDEKGLTLDCDLEEATFLSAPSLLELVWNNLLSNAVKFTPSGGKIGVSLKRTGEKAVVSVSDSGEGISTEDGARIFEKFYQGDSSRSSEGNGLGLALVKKVIDVLGGEISVKSEKGKGSVFTVTLKEVKE